MPDGFIALSEVAFRLSRSGLIFWLAKFKFAMVVLICARLSLSKPLTSARETETLARF